MNIMGVAPKFLVIPFDFIDRHALCSLSTYHHSYISNILDTALLMLGWTHYNQYPLVAIEPRDPGIILAQNIANHIRGTFFNQYRIRLIGTDYIVEMWYEKTN